MDAQEIKQLKELQDAYLSVYEAKKVDQDEDGDNDFADIRIARMVASGMSKAEAIRRVKDKSYNEEFVNEIFGLGGKKGTSSRADALMNSDYMKKKNKEADEKAVQNLRDMMSKDPERQKRPSRINNEEFEIDEATRMRRELGKEGETKTRQELAARSNAYQHSGSVDNTIAAAERGAKNPYVARGKNETEAEHNKRKQEQSQTLTRLASNRRGSVRDKPRAGLRGYAAKVDGDDKDLQSARGSARSAGTLTPKEKKQLGEHYNLVLSYLLDEGYAETLQAAEAIVVNMSESWIESIVESLI
jgi:hypothetical protein